MKLFTVVKKTALERLNADVKANKETWDKFKETVKSLKAKIERDRFYRAVYYIVGETASKKYGNQEIPAQYWVKFKELLATDMGHISLKDKIDCLQEFVNVYSKAPKNLIFKNVTDADRKHIEETEGNSADPDVGADSESPLTVDAAQPELKQLLKQVSAMKGDLRVYKFRTQIAYELLEMLKFLRDNRKNLHNNEEMFLDEFGVNLLRLKPILLQDREKEVAVLTERLKTVRSILEEHYIENKFAVLQESYLHFLVMVLNSRLDSDLKDAKVKELNDKITLLNKECTYLSHHYKAGFYATVYNFYNDLINKEALKLQKLESSDKPTFTDREKRITNIKAKMESYRAVRRIVESIQKVSADASRDRDEVPRLHTEQQTLEEFNAVISKFNNDRIDMQKEFKQQLAVSSTNNASSASTLYVRFDS